MITNGPIDTTVCIGSTANIFCGFVNESINLVPDWNITTRNDNGSVIKNVIFGASDIIANTNDGLEWIPDHNSGRKMSPNSRLVVGAVDETYNHSSYQCIFPVGGSIQSTIGTLTVTGMYVYNM